MRQDWNDQGERITCDIPHCNCGMPPSAYRLGMEAKATLVPRMRQRAIDYARKRGEQWAKAVLRGGRVRW